MTEGIGHNSGEVLNQTAQTELKSLVERWEHLLEERAEIGEHLKELKAESKGRGFDNKVIAAIIKARAADRAKQREFKAVMELYASALGDIELAELA